MKNIKLILKKWLYRSNNYSKANHDITMICNKYKFGETDFCSQLVCGGNEDKEYFPMCLFDEYELVAFEDKQFMVAKGWHEILSMNYGDYMQLPPLRERIPHSVTTLFIQKTCS